MKVLLVCEESQIVTKYFRQLGHLAWSCDILQTSGDHKEWHIKDNVLNHLKGIAKAMADQWGTQSFYSLL